MRRGTTGTDIPRAATDDFKGGILREAGEGGFLLGRPRDFAPEGSQTPHRGFKILILQLQKMWRLDILRQLQNKTRTESQLNIFNAHDVI